MQEIFQPKHEKMAFGFIGEVQKVLGGKYPDLAIHTSILSKDLLDYLEKQNLREADQVDVLSAQQTVVSVTVSGQALRVFKPDNDIVEIATNHGGTTGLGSLQPFLDSIKKMSPKYDKGLSHSSSFYNFE